MLEGVALVGGGLAVVLVPSPSSPHWTGKFAVDEAARNVLMLSSPSARSNIGTATDLALLEVLSLPLLVGVTQSFCRDDMKEAKKRSLMYATSLALAWGVTRSVEYGAARARPCTRDGDAGCSVSPYTSFFSTHTALAFTSAGFCWEARLGWGWCAIDTTLATAVGIGRIVADDHYLSDVVVGAIVGAASGALLPRLVSIDLGPDEQPIMVSVLPAVSTGRTGSSGRLVLQGTFR